MHLTLEQTMHGLGQGFDFRMAEYESGKNGLEFRLEESRSGFEYYNSGKNSGARVLVWLCVRWRPVGLHDAAMRDCSEHLATGARRQRRPVWRLLPVCVWRLDQSQHDTARHVSLGHVRSTASQESAGHQEPARYVMQWVSRHLSKSESCQNHRNTTMTPDEWCLFVITWRDTF